jgi:hypothetical protein
VRAALATAALIGALAASPPAARAEVERVVLIDLPPGVVAAVRTVLEPWRVEIVAIGAPSPGPSMPSSAERAQATITARDAGAAVWLADDGTGTALWIYDADSQRTTARRLPGPPPYDAPTAAAVALSVKTLLRFSRVAPVEERAATAPAVAPPPPPPPAGRPPRLELTARGGLRWRDTGQLRVEPRVALGLDVRHRVGGLALRFGADVRLGTGEAIDDARFGGHFGDVAGGLRLGVDLALGRLALSPWVGASIHATAIEGALRPSGARAHASRVNPALDLGGAATIAIAGGARLGLEVALGRALRRQRYLVADEPIFELPTTEVEAALLIQVPIW